MALACIPLRHALCAHCAVAPGNGTCPPLIYKGSSIRGWGENPPVYMALLGLASVCADLPVNEAKSYFALGVPLGVPKLWQRTCADQATN